MKGKVQITEENSDTLLTVDASTDGQSAIIKEALMALEALGYSKREISKVEKVLAKESNPTVDDAVKRGLQILVS